MRHEGADAQTIKDYALRALPSRGRQRGRLKKDCLAVLDCILVTQPVALRPAATKPSTAKCVKVEVEPSLVRAAHHDSKRFDVSKGQLSHRRHCKGLAVEILEGINLEVRLRILNLH